MSNEFLIYSVSYFQSCTKLACPEITLRFVVPKTTYSSRRYNEIQMRESKACELSSSTLSRGLRLSFFEDGKEVEVEGR